MATLYDTLVSQGVKPGDTYNVQGQLYNKLGSPYGNYSGTAQQNTFILGKLGGSHYNDILGGSNSSPGGSSGGGSSGGGSSGGGNQINYSIPSYDTNPQDYYSQALSLLQPTEQAQIAPIQQERELLPSIYQQKTTALTQDVADTQAQYAQKNKEIQDQSRQGQAAIGAANISNLGQQRAAEAARGITETSGVEQSQEANIQNQANAQIVNLTTNIANQLADLGLSESHDVNQLQQQIAALPNQQAMDALSYSTQIAQIQGQTWQQAISMGNQMLQTAADQAYKSFEIAMKEQDYQLAQARLQETISHNQAMEGLSGLRVQIEAQRAGSAQTSASALQDIRTIDLQNKEAPSLAAQDARSGTRLKDLLAKYSGVLKPNDVFDIYNTSSKYGAAKESDAELANLGVTPVKGRTATNNSSGGFDLGASASSVWNDVSGWFSSTF